MDGIDLLASSMAASEERLNVATRNIALQHVAAYTPEHFTSTLTAKGVQWSIRCSHRLSAQHDDPMHAMIDLVSAQRNFETDQKIVLAFDAVRAKDATELGRTAS